MRFIFEPMTALAPSHTTKDHAEARIQSRALSCTRATRGSCAARKESTLARSRHLAAGEIARRSRRAWCVKLKAQGNIYGSTILYCLARRAPMLCAEC